MHKDFHLTCNMLLYVVKFENPKSNRIFTLNVTIRPNMLN